MNLLQEILRYIFLMLRLQPEYAGRPVSPAARPGLSPAGAKLPEEEAALPPPASKPAQVGNPALISQTYNVLDLQVPSLLNCAGLIWLAGD